MSFKELLSRAKDDDLQAKEALLERYKSLLLKEAIIDGYLTRICTRNSA